MFEIIKKLYIFENFDEKFLKEIISYSEIKKYKS